MPGRALSTKAIHRALFLITATWALLLAGNAHGQTEPALTTEDVTSMWGSGGDRMSSMFLTQIFGPVFSIDGMETASSSIFPVAISMFNVICLVVGGLLFFYNVIAGVLQTAHEGEVLGRRWSSLWGPIRVLVAVAMLTPLPGYNGYNTVQTMVAYLVDGSTRVASAVWGEVAGLVVSGEVPITGASPQIPVAAAEMAWNMQICRATVIKQLSTARIQGQSAVDGRLALPGEASSDGNPYFRAIGTGVAVTPNLATDLGLASHGMSGMPLIGDWFTREDIAELERIQGDYVHSSVPPYAFMTVPHTNTDSATIIDNNLNTLTLCGIIATPPTPQSIQLIGDRELEANFVQTHRAVIAHALDRFADPAFHVVEHVASGRPVPDFSGVIAATSLEMRDLLVTGLRDVLVVAASTNSSTPQGQSIEQARQRMIRYISGGYTSPGCQAQQQAGEVSPVCAAEARQNQGQGWIGAGTWYMHLARLNSENHQIAGSAPVSYGSPEFTSRTNRISADAGIHNLLSNGNSGGYGSLQSAQEEAQNFYGAGLRAWDDAMATLGAFGGAFPRASAGDLFADDAESVLGRTIDESQFAYQFASFFSPTNFDVDPMVGIVNLGHLLTEYGLATVGAGGITSMIPIVGGPLSGFLNALGMPLLIAGSLLAFVIPLLPFIFWIVAVTGYFLLVAEAIVAVNLWAIAHLRMDGEGIAGEAARSGYYMVLALIFTPVLMIFGFLIGMQIFKVTTTLVNIGLYYVITGMHTGGGPAWIMGIVVITVMMVLVYTVLIERSFSLIMEFPSKVLQWIGANAALSSDEANRIRMAAMGATASAAGMGGPASSVVAGSAMAAGKGGAAGARGIYNRLPKSIRPGK